MLRLNLAREPYWLDLGLDVRVRGRTADHRIDGRCTQRPGRARPARGHQ